MVELDPDWRGGKKDLCKGGLGWLIFLSLHIVATKSSKVVALCADAALLEKVR